MTVKILPMRRVLISSSWPHSGKKYEVWENNKCIFKTNNEDEANEKAGEV